MGHDEEYVDLRGAIRTAMVDHMLEGLGCDLDQVIGNDLPSQHRLRIGVARMFLRDPQLVVFDDLVPWLDVEAERLLWDRVFERGGCTCLVVSRRRSALRRADRIVLLRKGKVEAVGSLETLLETSRLMRRLWRAASTDSSSL